MACGSDFLSMNSILLAFCIGWRTFICPASVMVQWGLHFLSFDIFSWTIIPEFVIWQGNLNLITQALAAVGCEMPVIPDPTTVHYHLPDNLSVVVHREYSEFVSELTNKFPHEKQGILKFYGVCWQVCSFLFSFTFQVDWEFLWDIFTCNSELTLIHCVHMYRFSMPWTHWNWSHLRSQSTFLDSSFKSLLNAWHLVSIFFCIFFSLQWIFKPKFESLCKI